MVDRNRLPVFDSALDRPRVIIHAFTADEMGIPLVEISFGGEKLHLTASQAERIGKGLVVAANISLGDDTL